MRFVGDVDFNGELVRLAFDGYRAPRYVIRDGFVAGELHPARGVAAGCGLATTMVKLVCLRAFECLRAKHGDVKFI